MLLDKAIEACNLTYTNSMKCNFINITSQTKVIVDNLI